MKFVSSAQMRALDKNAIERDGVPGIALMERAGRAIAGELLHLFRGRKLVHPSVLLVAGMGNNGGDAFVIARLLSRAGCRTSVLLAGRKEEVKGDARHHLDILLAEKVSVQEATTEDDWSPDRLSIPLVDLVVDGLLGTGSEGAPRGGIVRAIELINELGQQAQVAAIDLPSGMQADSGNVEGSCVVADYTFTLGLPKTGLLNPDAWDFAGSIEALDIGLSEKDIADLKTNGELELVNGDFVRSVLPRRPRQTNKGTYGNVLLIGGSQSYSGAISLAARGALASGAGLVSVYTPGSVAAIVAAQCPEAMITPLRENEEGALAAPLADAVSDLSRFSAILIGPGMTTHPDTLRILRDLLRVVSAPLIVDADALNVVEGRGHWLDNSSSPTVITPHPGEMARLLGVDMMTVLGDRKNVAHNAAEITGGAVALKGAGTMLADGKGRRMINLTGNPGMASGGTGDVLAGLVAGFVAQGLDTFDALAVAVYVHGKAGDLVASRMGQHGLKATDLAAAIPEVMRFVL